MKELDLNKISEVINHVDGLIQDHFAEINKMMSDKNLLDIFKEYNQHKEEHRNSGFNIFNIISDKYYYENFHSDIISVFLDSGGEHKEDDRFVKLFIELLQRLKPELNIQSKDFTRSSSIREEYRIDILIQDDETHKAIIIENKIYNASDTYRQIPTYVSVIGEENVAAIVYLPLNPDKLPDTKGWTDEEILFVNSKLICLPAFNRTDNDLYKGWLLPCIKNSSSNDTETILKQYSKLIQKIGGIMMDEKLYGKFYENAISNIEFYKTSVSIKDFIENLIHYRAQKICETFNKEALTPFVKVTKTGSDVYFEGYQWDGHKYKIVLSCDIDKYRLRFWDEDYKKNHLLNTSRLIEKLKDSNINKLSDNDEYLRIFSFPEEEKPLYDYIRQLRKDLLNIL